MKKLLLSALALVMFLGCSEKTDKQNATSAETKKEANFFRVGTAANYPPFEYIDNTKMAGFDIDLMREIGKKIGVKFEFVNMSFDGLIPAVKGGKIDIIASAMSATDARRKSIDFSDAYYKTENLYLKKKGNDTIKSKQDLNGKKIGVQLGTVQEMAAKKIDGANVVPAEETVSLILALKSGKVDSVLFDSSIGYGYLKKNQDLVAFFNEPDGSEGFSIAFDKGKQNELIAKVNKAIKDLKADGTYDKLLKQYDLK